MMTIMSPCRRPGHVSMEPGDFPAHTVAAQRLPWDGHRCPVAFTTHRSAPTLVSPSRLFPPACPPMLHGRQNSGGPRDWPRGCPAPWSLACKAVRQQAATPTPSFCSPSPRRPDTGHSGLHTCSFFALVTHSCWLLGALLREASQNPWLRLAGPLFALTLLPAAELGPGLPPSRREGYFCPRSGWGLDSREWQTFGDGQSPCPCRVPHPPAQGSAWRVSQT